MLNTLNTRLDAEAIAFMLDHGEAKVLITDREFSPIVGKALGLMSGPKPLVIDVDDPAMSAARLLGEIDYEAFLAEGDPAFAPGRSRRRMGRHRAELHVRHDRQSRRASSITIAARYLNAISNHPRLGHAGAFGLSVDAADVPLQRLVLSLDHGGNAGANVCLRRIDAEADLRR